MHFPGKVRTAILAAPFAGAAMAFVLWFLKVQPPFGKEHWLYLIVIMPIVEEIVFRKFLYRWMRGWTNAVVFGAYHALGMFNLPAEFWWPFMALQISGATLVGRGFVWARETTGSFIPGTIMHAFLNAGFLATTVYLGRN